MKFCKPAFLLYHLYHPIKDVNFQCLNWYRYNLLTYTIAIPPIPKKTGKVSEVGQWFKTYTTFFGTCTPPGSRASRGFEGWWYRWDGKNRIFSFFYFVGVFRRSFHFLAIARGVREATL